MALNQNKTRKSTFKRGCISLLSLRWSLVTVVQQGPGPTGDTGGAEPALPRAGSLSREWRAAHLGVPLVVVLLRADPAAHQVVAHRVCQRKEVVAGRGHIAVLNQREVQVPVEALPHLGHVA